jgi:hypothetical protein
VLFGSTMPIANKYLLTEKEGDKKGDHEEKKDDHENHSQGSHYSELIHPNI